MNNMLVRTGKKIKFLDVNIGQPFFAHDRFWTRTRYEDATEIKESTSIGANACNFTLDACDEYVEEAKLEIG